MLMRRPWMRSWTWPTQNLRLRPGRAPPRSRILLDTIADGKRCVEKDILDKAPADLNIERALQTHVCEDLGFFGS